jgi:hypothetical protein
METNPSSAPTRPSREGDDVIRCPQCHRACAAEDRVCRHCGSVIQHEPKAFWRRQDWLSFPWALESMAASLALLLTRMAVHPLLMAFEGGRQEARVATFHLVIGLTAGLAVACLRRREGRWGLWILAGLLGGALDWAFDYAFMADHVISQAVFEALNWLDSSPASRAIPIGFGILQTLRFTGLVFVFWIAMAWNSRPGPKLRIALFSLIALAFRAPVLGYALAPGLALVYPKQALLYFLSFLAYFYGVARIDEDSVK